MPDPITQLTFPLIAIDHLDPNTNRRWSDILDHNGHLVARCDHGGMALAIVERLNGGALKSDAITQLHESYRIKPLEWIGSTTMVRAETPLITYEVWKSHSGDVFWWDVNDRGGQTCDSLEAGKLAAEVHYRARLSAALEPASR